MSIFRRPRTVPYSPYNNRPEDPPEYDDEDDAETVEDDGEPDDDEPVDIYYEGGR